MRRNAKSLSVITLALCALIVGAAAIPIHSLRPQAENRATTAPARRGTSVKIADSVVQDAGSVPRSNASTVIYPAHGTASGWNIARATGGGNIYVGPGNVTTVIVRQ